VEALAGEEGEEGVEASAGEEARVEEGELAHRRPVVGAVVVAVVLAARVEVVGWL
jgi:hypothetical protein